MSERKTGVVDVNPFFVYILAFSIVLIIYQLDWSYLFPDLSLPLMSFLTITFLISGLIGIYVHRKGVLKFYEIKNRLNVNWWVFAITIGYIANFVYSKRVPFFAVFSNEDTDYGNFGIPTFYVILVTFTGFFTVYLFNCYVIEKKKKYLFLCMYLFIFPLLVFSRGAILINLSSVFFVYLFSYKGNRIKIYFRLIVMVLAILIGFGVLGNVRNSQTVDETTDLNDAILRLGDAKPDFVDSAIPKEYFWSYLYIASPLANLQLNVNEQQPNYSFSTIWPFINGELDYDFISKRIFDIYHYQKPQNKLITPALTVCTVYSTSYSYLGWWGMSVMFIFLMAITFLYFIIMKPQNPYFSTGVAILNTFLLFCIFDNMFAFSPLSFQLVYPILLSLKFKKTKPAIQTKPVHL